MQKFFSKIKKTPADITACEDLFSLCRNIEQEDFALAHSTNEELRKQISAAIKHRINVEGFFELYKKTLLFDEPDFFDSYLLYLEINRKPEERFCQPRRKVLKRVVDALQKLTNDELYGLFISMPPRVGKTTILMFFVTWLIGGKSEAFNLYSAYSDTITKALYNGVLEIINDTVTYLWHDVFPNAKVVQTNSQDETINIDRRKRYPSLTCRSLYGTLNGAVTVTGLRFSMTLSVVSRKHLIKTALFLRGVKWITTYYPVQKKRQKFFGAAHGGLW